MIFIQKHLKVYGNTIEINQFWINIDYPADNNNVLFKFKEKIKGQKGDKGKKDNEIKAAIKYLSNFGEPLKCH